MEKTGRSVSKYHTCELGACGGSTFCDGGPSSLTTYAQVSEMMMIDMTQSCY